jgi:hypothetical protein
MNMPTTEATKPATRSKKPALMFFDVILAWNPNDSGEGDFQENVWAKDPAHAVKVLARRMAEMPESGCETAAERRRFVNNAVETASSHAVSFAASQLLDDCKELLAGPKEKMSAEAKVDFAALSAILKKYGAL